MSQMVPRRAGRHSVSRKAWCRVQSVEPRDLLRALSTMNPSELLEPDLTGRAKFVGTDDSLSTDERAEIHACEVLSASRTQTRVREVARRVSTVRT